MKKCLFCIVVTCSIFSCTKRETYVCTIKNDIGFASATITSVKEFDFTPAEKADYENRHNTDSKTAECVLK